MFFAWIEHFFIDVDRTERNTRIICTIILILILTITAFILMISTYNNGDIYLHRATNRFTGEPCSPAVTIFLWILGVFFLGSIPGAGFCLLSLILAALFHIKDYKKWNWGDLFPEFEIGGSFAFFVNYLAILLVSGLAIFNVITIPDFF